MRPLQGPLTRRAFLAGLGAVGGAGACEPAEGFGIDGYSARTAAW